ncbi:MAG: helix-turn-helix transcriptional regulator [Phormidesmis sp. RL_2_1]|nr:helix-turn-helix transcriptional regulator [Phormidesmis sp. RL_2_1]
MSIDLNLADFAALWTEAEQQHAPVTSIDRLETIYTVPPKIGNGYQREMRLQPGIDLCIFNRTYRDVRLHLPESQHLVQFMVNLTGIIDSGDFLYQDSEWGYIGGSGIQRPVASFFSRSQRNVGVDIHIQPQVLIQLFGTSTGEPPPELKPLLPGDNHWQRVFSPKTTGAMRAVVRQMIDCPFVGATKRLYMQGKVFELMTLQIEGAMIPGSDAANKPMVDSQTRAMKPDTVARLHQAAAMVRSRLENPPSQTELAREIGMCERSLRRGFKQLFGMTIVAYLTQQRLQQAEQTLREGDCTVTEVANQVGYAHLGHFAAAFKKHFGITPSQCMARKRTTVGV